MVVENATVWQSILSFESDGLQILLTEVSGTNSIPQVAVNASNSAIRNSFNVGNYCNKQNRKFNHFFPKNNNFCLQIYIFSILFYIFFQAFIISIMSLACILDEYLLFSWSRLPQKTPMSPKLTKCQLQDNKYKLQNIILYNIFPAFNLYICISPPGHQLIISCCLNNTYFFLVNYSMKSPNYINIKGSNGSGLFIAN